MISALVLAAGLGTRLDPLTRLVAKAAVPLGDRSLLEHVVDWLRKSGVTDVVINLHHHPDTITRLVGDGSHLGLAVRYSWEQPVLGSAGGPRRALALLASDPFLIVNGDTLTDVDLDVMTRTHESAAAEVTMAVVPNPAPDHYNGIRMGPAGEVLGFMPKGQAEGTWHFIGIQIAAKSMFSHLQDGVSSDTVAGFYRDVVQQEPGRIRGYPVSTPFLDVGTPADYLRACLAVAAASPLTGRRQNQSLTGATVDPTNETVMWREATVDPSAHLRRSIVAGPVVVPAGFEAHDAIIVPRAVVRPSDHVEMRGDLAVFELRS